jgi:hypothetical protein
MVRRLTPTSSHAFMIEIVLRSIIISASATWPLAFGGGRRLTARAARGAG